MVLRTCFLGFVAHVFTFVEDHVGLPCPYRFFLCLDLTETFHPRRSIIAYTTPGVVSMFYVPSSILKNIRSWKGQAPGFSFRSIGKSTQRGKVWLSEKGLKTRSNGSWHLRNQENSPQRKYKLSLIPQHCWYWFESLVLRPSSSSLGYLKIHFLQQKNVQIISTASKGLWRMQSNGHTKTHQSNGAGDKGVDSKVSPSINRHVAAFNIDNAVNLPGIIKTLQSFADTFILFRSVLFFIITAPIHYFFLANMIIRNSDRRMEPLPGTSRQTHRNSRPLTKIGTQAQSIPIMAPSLGQAPKNTTPCEGGRKRHHKKSLGLMLDFLPRKKIQRLSKGPLSRGGPVLALDRRWSV